MLTCISYHWRMLEFTTVKSYEDRQKSFFCLNLWPYLDWSRNYLSYWTFYRGKWRNKTKKSLSLISSYDKPGFEKVKVGISLITWVEIQLISFCWGSCNWKFGTFYRLVLSRKVADESHRSSTLWKEWAYRSFSYQNGFKGIYALKKIIQNSMRRARLILFSCNWSW